jgi:hypothetical protein
MPDTGEDREIPQRINAKEAEISRESRKLLEKAKSLMKKTFDKGRRPEKKREPAKR